MYNLNSRSQQFPQDPYAYNMTGRMPGPMPGMANSNIPALSASMLTPNLNKQAFMGDTDMGGKPQYAMGGSYPGYNDGGSVGLAELAQLLSQGNQDTNMYPRYAKGGLLKKVEKFAKKVAPFALPIVGGMIGGPGGAALGGGLGGFIGGGKHKVRNALIGAGLGYVGGHAVPALGARFGAAGAGAGGLGGMINNVGAGLGNKIANMDMNQALLTAAVGGSLFGGVKKPKEGGLNEQIAAMRHRNQGPPPRQVKPMERVQRILSDEDIEDAIESGRELQYFEDANPDVQYFAHGGYLDGDTGGEEDKINAKLSDGEYVLRADVVSGLGDGNNKAGAKKLDRLQQAVLAHKGKNRSNKAPLKAKSLTTYMKARGA